MVPDTEYNERASSKNQLFGLSLEKSILTIIGQAVDNTTVSRHTVIAHHAT